MNIKEFEKDFMRGINVFTSQIKKKPQQISIKATVNEEWIAPAIP